MNNIKNNLFWTLLLCNIFFSSSISFAQIKTGELPVSFKNIKRGMDTIPSCSISENGILLESENDLSGNSKKLIFARVYETNISPDSHGMWENLSNGGRIWRLQIVSYGAYSLNFTLDYIVPLQAKLFVYTPDKKYTAGAFTSRNNNSSGILNIAPVPGDTTVFEYYIPKGSVFNNDFTIKRVGHDFSGLLFKNDIKTEKREISGSCNVDVSCPEGRGWDLEKNAVCKILVNNKEICTGTLINNMKDNGKPYLITAKHCITNYYDAANTLFIFNYESMGCDGEANPFSNSLSGSQMRAFSFDLDFALVELLQEPPISYTPYCVGWNVENVEPQKTVCIHHPNGDVKKISKDNEAAITDDYGEGLRAYSHWKVLKWDLGTTEKGSSGAPLFDQNHKLVGILSGGQADCVNSVNDYYSKLYHIWDTFSKHENQIKYWLNPLDLNVVEHNGLNPYYSLKDYDAEIWKKIYPEYELCNIDTFRPSFVIRNRGQFSLYELNVGYVVNDAPAVEKKWYGNLLSNKSETIEFDLISLPVGMHKIKYYISKPNSKQDENLYNDTLYFEFKVSNGYNLGIDIMTDEYGNETSWKLFDNKGELTHQKFALEKNSLVSTKLCVPADCYEFIVKDNGGDGLCCDNGEGYYHLYNSINNDTIVFGKEFMIADTIQFCLQREMKEQKTAGKLSYISVYPSPGAADFNILIKDKELQSVILTGTEVKLEVFDIFGQLVYVNQYHGKQISFSLAGFERGVYFAVVVINGKRYSCKFHLF